jgi:hypothetical protein
LATVSVFVSLEGGEKKSLGKHGFVKVGVLLVISVFALSVIVQTVNASLALENVQTWQWAYDTEICSVASGDVDADGKAEIVTGGYCNQHSAQLCVWNGATLGLEKVQTWTWNMHTVVESVAAGDVDGDGKAEIVTGGHYFDGTRYVAQLCIWSGATLALERIRTWYWTGATHIYSVAVGNVDGDAQMEIVTGGSHWDGTDFVAQLCIWNGATLALENIRTWKWSDNTEISSVAIGDVDGDGKTEIVTGGHCNLNVAQLCIWNGATLTLENVRTWKWGGETVVLSVAIGDVTGTSPGMEIVTGGFFHDGTRRVAQLCVWKGTTLDLCFVNTWYWTGWTYVTSVAVWDPEGPSVYADIITGGHYYDGTHYVAQLCVWSGSLALEDVQTWKWGWEASISSVAVGNVDGDSDVEIVTGGKYYETSYAAAQMCVWA